MYWASKDSIETFKPEQATPEWKVQGEQIPGAPYVEENEEGAFTVEQDGEIVAGPYAAEVDAVRNLVAFVSGRTTEYAG